MDSFNHLHLSKDMVIGFANNLQLAALNLAILSILYANLRRLPSLPGLAKAFTKFTFGGLK